MSTASEMPIWERRFRAPLVTFPAWARSAPHRLVFASNETGAYQVYACDCRAGLRRQVTAVPIGVTDALPTPEGTDVVWFDDESGDEVGQWVAEPFEGGEQRPLVVGVPQAWSAGLAIGDRVVVVGTAEEQEFSVHRSFAGRPAEVVHRHPEVVQVAGLSRDDSLLCLAHAEHGDSLHLALRVLHLPSGETRGDLWDGEGFGLQPAGWSPVPGDQRLAVVAERTGKERPGVWDLGTGQRHDIDLELPGDVTVAGWWPDASALLLIHTVEGRDQLLRHDLASGATSPVDHPRGSILEADVRPDGQVWYQFTSGATPPSVCQVGAEAPVVAAVGEPSPPGYPYRTWHFANPHGQLVHGFVVEPPAQRPHACVMLIHGGPHWLWADAWRPEVAAWVDHGFAVALVNYRGSTGYGREWRDALVGDPGFSELEDIVAGLDALVRESTVDPARVVLAGGSWGGYLTLLGLGRYPQRWVAGVAVVPVADYLAAYEDEAPGLKALDRILFGGAPQDRPELYLERSPITYVDSVRVPLLIVAGDNDSRCPIRQVLRYVAELEARGLEHEVYRFDAGHGSMVIDERVRQMAAELVFVLGRVQP